MARLALAAFLGLLLVLGGMTLFQDQLIFPTGAVPRAGPLPDGAEPITVNASTGEGLRGVHFRPANPKAAPATLIIGFGGNAWNAQHVAEYLHELYPDADVIAFHYRGYAPSAGSPSAAALLEDAPVILAAARDRVDAEKVVVVGFSIGSGVAASLAKEEGVDGLILVTPFDSLKAVAAQLYPWFPVAPFFQHEINSSSYLERSTLPVAIIAAELDQIIPPARTDSLRQNVPALRFDRTIAGAGHNDIYGNPLFRKAMAQALKAVAGK